MEIINDNGLNIAKGEKFVVLKVEEEKYIQSGYEFIDGLLVKGYTLLSMVPFITLGKHYGFLAHLTKT